MFQRVPCLVVFTNNSLLKFPIQTGTPNWKCYPKTGYPGCCSKKNGQNCPTSYQDAQAKYPCSNEDVIAEEEDESTISEEVSLTLIRCRQRRYFHCLFPAISSLAVHSHTSLNHALSPPYLLSLIIYSSSAVQSPRRRQCNRLGPNLEA